MVYITQQIISLSNAKKVHLGRRILAPWRKVLYSQWVNNIFSYHLRRASFMAPLIYEFIHHHLFHLSASGIIHLPWSIKCPIEQNAQGRSGPEKSSHDHEIRFQRRRPCSCHFLIFRLFPVFLKNLDLRHRRTNKQMKATVCGTHGSTMAVES